MQVKSGIALLAARLGLAILFLMSGLGKLGDWSGTVAYAGTQGVPAFLLAGAVALEIVGGLSILVGYKTRWGVAALLVFLAPVTLLFHGFWNLEGAEAHLQTILFFKNVSIAGGLLALGAAGPGAYALDARKARTTEASASETVQVAA